MLVKSASLCDDCYKTAEKHQHQHHAGGSPADQQQQNKLTQSQNSSACISNISSTASVPSVINKKQTDAMVETAAAAAAVAETEISPDDDGYCEIDEIRLPAITKSPSIKINDPRRQSAPAPLPPPETTNDSTEQSPKDDATAKPNHEHNKPADTISDEQTQDTSSSGSAQTVVSNKHDAEHIEVNDAYESLSQPLSALNLNNDTPTSCLSGSNSVGMPPPAASPPCDLLLKLLPYVTSLNQHISQLLVSTNYKLINLHLRFRFAKISFFVCLQPKINERDIEREKLRKENQVLRDRLNLLHERELTQSEN